MNGTSVFVHARRAWLGFIDARVHDGRRDGLECENLERLRSILEKRLESVSYLRAEMEAPSLEREWIFARAILRAETGIVSLEMKDRLIGNERQLLGMAVADGEMFFRKALSGLVPGVSLPDGFAMIGGPRSAGLKRTGLRLLHGGGGAPPSVQGTGGERISGTILQLLLKDGARPELGVRGVLETASGRTGFSAEGQASTSLLRMGAGAAVALDGKLRQRVFHVEAAMPSLRMVSDGK